MASALALFGVTGCDGEEPMDDAGPPIEIDAGAGGACSTGATIPTSGFGTSEGRNLIEFENITTCDGTPFSFYGADEGYCDARFTVVVMSAGWCGPCRAEATEMQSQLIDVYGPQGVRVLVALIQDNDYMAPDQSFCDGWVSQYGLSNPVLLDPTQATQVYFPAGSLPANLIVDNQGRIVHREYGFSEALGTIRAQLDSLLAE